ncbi:MAG TPA: hypothetical protein V6C58_27545 [Allocoleopsis sp.]
MKLVKYRLQNLINQILPEMMAELSEDSVNDAWEIAQQLYYDWYMLKAISECKQIVSPGDTLNLEEAINVLLNLP